MNGKSIENEKLNSCCMNCGENDCCHNSLHGGKLAVLRWLLGIVVLLIVFGVGFKLGEFKESFGRPMWQERGFGGGYKMMNGAGGSGFPGMMYFNAGPENGGTALPVPTARTVPGAK